MEKLKLLILVCFIVVLFWSEASPSQLLRMYDTIGSKFFVSRPKVRNLSQYLSVDRKKILVVQAFDEKYANKIGNLTSEWNEKWCQKHGYNYKLFLKDPLPNTKAHYLRYWVILECLKLNKYSHIVYIDGDAIFNLNASSDIIPCSDKIIFGNEFGFLTDYSIPYGLDTPINSGFISVPDNSESKEIISRILYDPRCEPRTQRIGSFYDQGCINIVVAPDEANVSTVQWYTFDHDLLISHISGKGIHETFPGVFDRRTLSDLRAYIKENIHYIKDSF